MRYTTFNVLADAYTGYGDYSHVDPELLNPGTRLEGVLSVIARSDADVIGLQEVEEPFVRGLKKMEGYQTFWTPKGRNKPDGCATLIRDGIAVDDFTPFAYDDGSGHVAQLVTLDGMTIANTHLKWAPEDAPDHIGVSQTSELLEQIGDVERAVILADSNDRPGGPVRGLLASEGYTDIVGDLMTAIVDGQPVALDIIAVRGLSARLLTPRTDVSNIPNDALPSDHIPVSANISR